MVIEFAAFILLASSSPGMSVFNAPIAGNRAEIISTILSIRLRFHQQDSFGKPEKTQITISSDINTFRQRKDVIENHKRPSLHSEEPKGIVVRIPDTGGLKIAFRLDAAGVPGPHDTVSDCWPACIFVPHP